MKEKFVSIIKGKEEFVINLDHVSEVQIDWRLADVTIWTTSRKFACSVKSATALLKALGHSAEPPTEPPATT